MALRATKPNEDAARPRGAKASALPPGFCPAPNRFPPVAYSGSGIEFSAGRNEYYS
jgi:hypothetical protein